MIVGYVYWGLLGNNYPPYSDFLCPRFVSMYCRRYGKRGACDFTGSQHQLKDGFEIGDLVILVMLTMSVWLLKSGLKKLFTKR